jgi:hypothetical protein
VKNIIHFIKVFFYYLFRRDAAFIRQKLAEVEQFRAILAKQQANAPVVYTSVQSFNSQAGDKLFWPWVRMLIKSEEYKYLIFSLRESVIGELVQTSDPDKMRELNGQLKMLKVIDNYLTTGLTQYDAEQKNKVRRDNEAA